MNLRIHDLGDDGKPKFMAECTKCGEKYYSGVRWARHLMSHPQ